MGIENVFKKTKEFLTGVLSEEEALKRIESHPVKKEAYEKMKAEDPEKAEKYVDFVRHNPTAKYVQWNEEKKRFEDKGRYGLSGL